MSTLIAVGGVVLGYPVGEDGGTLLPGLWEGDVSVVPDNGLPDAWRDLVRGARCAAENVNASTAPLGTLQSGPP
ncbi:hypothetical protein GCM10010384_54810 [Streptomyces djakartensis]|uniref:Uncharacterized protein n=1 Tax=Streptomyces djakartensis TaxID=68193 RepID=A0ABQ3A8V8_9ACTN|nr:hypothetical protein GCM10010384_54810 [Streptomyces djakartensis]